MTKNKLPKLAYPKPLMPAVRAEEKSQQEIFLAKLAELDKKFNE